jgi:protein SCO1/2
MNRNLLWILLFSAFAAAVVVRFVPRGQRASVARVPTSEEAAEARSDDDLPKLWDAPAFEFDGHAGRKLTLEDLRGQVWIANFIFTECTSICPMMTAKMVLLQRSLSAPQLRFVSYSVDPENDTPEVLRDYAKDWSPAETRWSLLATDTENLLRVAKGFGVTVQKTDDVDDPILHSNRFFLVDPRGLIRGAYLSDDDEALERLVSDATKLLAREFPNSQAAHAELSGPELFDAMGCAGCHNNPRLGPPLAGVFGRAVKLDDGGEVPADAEYLREALLDPSARIVDGYRGTMPNYAGVLSDAQIARLIEHLKSLPAPAETQATPTLAYDPVCKMEVTTFDDSPSAEHEGVRYWFCCEHCQAQFVANPARFTAKKP